MFCKFCGKNIPSTSKVCPSCGESLREVSRPAAQVQMVSVQIEKNLGLGIALAVLAGPLGLLYASARWGCILIAINVVSLLVSCGTMFGGAASGDKYVGGASIIFGSLLFWMIPLVSWIGSIVLAWHSITEYNKNVRKGIANSDVN